MLAVLTKGFLLSLSLCLDLGVVNTALVNAGIRAGVRPAFFIGLGSCFGDLFYAVLSLTGLALIFHYQPVKWVFWLGGGALLLFMTWKMTHAAWREARGENRLRFADTCEALAWSPKSEFLRGFGLAMASPTSLTWFAAVGGAVIAQSTDGSALSGSIFLAGFFLGGLAYSAFLAVLAGKGRHVIGDKLALYCYALSAGLFAYLAADVLWSGYRTLLSGPTA